MLPSHAIGNFLFPTYEVVIMSLSHSSALNVTHSSALNIMAARSHAAASLSPDRTVFLCFLSCKSQCFCTSSSRLPEHTVVSFCSMSAESHF